MEIRTGLGLAIVLTTMAAGIAASDAANLEVTVTGLRNDKGIVRCGLFGSRQGFGKPGHEIAGAKAPIRAGTARCSFPGVAPGTYAVAVFHAENHERTLQVGMFGKPKQGVGFSNNPSIAFGAPGFDKAAFRIDGDRTAIRIRVQY